MRLRYSFGKGPERREREKAELVLPTQDGGTVETWTMAHFCLT